MSSLPPFRRNCTTGGMAMPGAPTIAPPDADLAPLISEINRLGAKLEKQHHVILFDDDVHTIEFVIELMMFATHCNQQKAIEVTWTVHTQGQAVAFEGDMESCQKVAAIFQKAQMGWEIR